MTEVKPKRGGARRGAGRPADPSVRVMIRMKLLLHERIKAQAEEDGQSVPEWIRQASEEKLDR